LILIIKIQAAKFLVEVKDVSFGYDQKIIFYLKIFHLLFKKGETLGIIGKNGKGKSTFKCNCKRIKSS
jgi:ATP-binding cassette subfamily F protein 3